MTKAKKLKTYFTVVGLIKTTKIKIHLYQIDANDAGHALLIATGFIKGDLIITEIRSQQYYE